MNVLVPRDAAGDVVSYLAPLLSVTVSDAPVAGDCLVVRVIGSTRTNRVTDSVLVAVQGYSPDRDRAFDLTAEAWAALLASDEDDAAPWRSVYQQGDGPIPFPDDDLPAVYRFQATARVNSRGR